MKISVFPAYGSINSKPVFDAFIQNLKDKKENYKINSYDDDTDVAVIWSVLWQGRMRSNRNIWEQFKKRNKPVVVLEVGGIKRNITWKVGINGINRDADFANETFDDKRWKKFDIQMKPWKQDGKNIIICGQHDTSEQWKNLPRMNNWLLEQITKIKKYTDKSTGGFKSKTMFTPMKKGAPVHTKASVIYNDLLKHFKATNHEPISNGNKVRWVYLKQNPYNIDGLAYKGYDDPKEIIDFINQYIDRDKLFDKALNKKIKMFYDAMSWDMPVDKKSSIERFF